MLASCDRVDGDKVNKAMGCEGKPLDPSSVMISWSTCILSQSSKLSSLAANVLDGIEQHDSTRLGISPTRASPCFYSWSSKWFIFDLSDFASRLPKRQCSQAALQGEMKGRSETRQH